MSFELERTIEQATTFDEIKEIRKGFRSAARQNKIDFTSALAEANKKPTHFVLELLQNAEDADASEVNITLYQDRFVFSHNGTKKFRLRDVRGITGLGDSGKDNDENTIGHFGMGFKSVFGICAEPEIYAECDFEPSCNIAFKIEDLFVPERIDNDGRYNKGTHFVLRFESTDMTVEQTYNLLFEEITTLNSDCILFLRNIKKVTWKIDGVNTGGEFHKGKNDERTNDIAAYRTIYSGGAIESQYLFFERSFEFDDKTFYTSIAYRVEKDKAGKRFLALERADTKLFVFFPCEGENTYLKFKINAPFMTTSNRDAIIEKEKYKAYNNRVLAEIIALYTDSLPCIKESGYFDTAFLSLLPIYPQLQSQSGKFAQRFYLKTIEALKTGAYLPTENGEHAKANQALLVGSKDLVELLDEGDAASVFSGRGKWLDSAITSNGSTASLHSVIRSLEVPDIDASSFIRTVSDKFIAGKSDEWLIEFYKAMTNIAMVRNYLSKKFIRLENDQMVAPFVGDIPNAFLPREGMKPTAKSIKAVFCRNEDARAFFEYIKVGTADIVEEIRQFIDELKKSKDPDDYILSLCLVQSEYKDASEEKRRRIAEIIRNEVCLLCEDEERTKTFYAKPTDAFVRYNNVQTIYSGIPNICYIAKVVADAGEDGEFNQFLKAIGVSFSIRLKEQNNGLTWEERRELYGKAQVSSYSESSYQLEHMDAIISTMTEKKSLALWKLLERINEDYCTGLLKWWYGRSYNNAEFKAYFIRSLQKARWIYDEQGNPVAPNEIYLADLLKKYPTNKVLEKYLVFKPDIRKTLPKDEQVRLDLTDGLPIDYLKKAREAYLREIEENTDFNPEVDVDDCDAPITEEAFTNKREGTDAEDLEKDEEQAEEDDTTGDLDDAIADIYGDGADTPEDDKPEDFEKKVVARTVSDKSKKIGLWGEHLVFKRIKERFIKDGYTIKDETESLFKAVKGGDILTIEHHNAHGEVQMGYDISIRRGSDVLEYIEVKTREKDIKQYFTVSGTQWEFCKTLEKEHKSGDKYCVYLVTQAGTKAAEIQVFRNPYKNWVDGKLEADPVCIKL